MTTAHRPTFDPARGKEVQRGPAYHQRLLPAYTKLKVRQPGQGGDADKSDYRDLRAELLQAEADHFSKTKGSNGATRTSKSHTAKISGTDGNGERKRLKGPEEDEDMDKGESDDEAHESPETKRRRILASTRDLDADSDGENKSSSSDGGDSDDDDEEDDDDETAELLRELEKIKRERAETREREEREKAAKAENDKIISIARGNPLLNPDAFSIKRRWDDDVIFKNQARGTDDRNKKKEFVNDLLRSDFHKKFMNKYVR